MSSRQDIINQKLALQDSMKAETNPKKRKAMQKRFDKLRIPNSVDMEKSRTDTMNKRMKMPNVTETIRKRNAALDSVRKMK